MQDKGQATEIHDPHANCVRDCEMVKQSGKAQSFACRQINPFDDHCGRSEYKAKCANFYHARVKQQPGITTRHGNKASFSHSFQLFLSFPKSGKRSSVSELIR